ncbi:MAG: HK97 gp10 family phage protein [Alistipes sp.]|nr:HK97 gp10 family phage protein [Alistipes sp.]
MLKIKVVGYQEAKVILDELPNNMQKRMLMTALRSSAKPMLQSAKSKVPVRSGRLKRQLRIVRFRDRQASKSEVAIAVKPVFEKTKKGAINQYYGKFIHEGTANPRVPRKQGKTLVFENASGEKIFVKSVKGIHANPYLEQAYTENSERLVSSFGDELAAAVEKFVSKNFRPVQ